MAIVSRGAGPAPGADAFAREKSSAAPMTSAERRTYRRTVGALITLWLAVVITFSPWGVAGPR
jgi:hypothetical protein